MNTEAYGTTTFCDDIRHEVNGKLTLVGCYSGSLNFSGPAPGALPTFAALVNLRVPTNIQFAVISLRVTKIEADEETIIFDKDFEKPDEHNAVAPAFTDDTNEEGSVFFIAFPCQLTPLKFSKSGQIRVRAYLDDCREIHLGTLSVRFTEQPPEDQLKGK